MHLLGNSKGTTQEDRSVEQISDLSKALLGFFVGQILKMSSI